jgi:hypothetical protein
VAEYVNNEKKDRNSTSAAKIETDTISAGAILFF